uniref:Uncharacterized protein n=1 Tax=Oryza barthii TaxID=65489 RepID=A0A0D3F7P6_9ORYZ
MWAAVVKAAAGQRRRLAAGCGPRHRIRVDHCRIWSQVREGRRVASGDVVVAGMQAAAGAKEAWLWWWWRVEERGGEAGGVEAGAARGDAAGGVAWRPARRHGVGCVTWSVEAGSAAWRRGWQREANAGESLAVPLAGSMTTTSLAPFPFLKALSWCSAICPTNLQVKILLRPRTSGDNVTRRVLLRGVASGKFLTSMTIDGPFGSKAFFPWHSARPKPLGSASFYGGRHSSVASADEVGAARCWGAATLGNDDVL